MRRTGQYKGELTLSPRLHVKPLITAIRAIARTVVSFLVDLKVQKTNKHSAGVYDTGTG